MPAKAVSASKKEKSCLYTTGLFCAEGGK